MTAVRDIAAGEEITISYIDVANRPREDRLRELKRRYSFDCVCVACLDTTGKSDLQRSLLCMPHTDDYRHWPHTERIKFLLARAVQCTKEGYHIGLRTACYELTAEYAFIQDAKNVKRWGFKLILLGSRDRDMWN